MCINRKCALVVIMICVGVSLPLAFTSAGVCSGLCGSCVAVSVAIKPDEVLQHDLRMSQKQQKSLSCFEQFFFINSSIYVDN